MVTMRLSASCDSTQAINAALQCSRDVLLPDGLYLASGIDIPCGASLSLSANAVIIPAKPYCPVVRLHSGGCISGGTIDTCRGEFNSAVLDIDGDDQAQMGFSLSMPTKADISIVGAKGSGKGTALYMHADGLPTARIMGVDAKLRITGMTFGVRLRQTSVDGSQFVNGNRIDAWCSETWQALYMDTPNGAFHIDGNIVRIQHQSLAGTTAPSAYISGQMNKIYLIPWDWDAVCNTSAHSVTLAPGARFNEISVLNGAEYVQNNSGNTLNSIDTLSKQIVGRETHFAQGLFPAYPGNFAQSNVAVWAGGGAPPNWQGENGHFYFNSAGGGGQPSIYQKRGGAWTAVI